jgi:hypothetical protein
MVCDACLGAAQVGEQAQQNAKRETAACQLVSKWCIWYVHVEVNVQSPSQVVVDTIDHEIKYDNCWDPVTCDLGEERLSLATHALHELFIFDEYLQGEQAEIRVQGRSCRPMCMLE